MGINTAPYNFIPLNDFILPDDNQENNGHNRYNPDLNSGIIEYTLTNHTDFLIKADGKFFIESGGKCLVPGSSMRGLMRHMMTIMGKGRMETDNKQLYYRQINGDPNYNYQGGWLYKKDGKFFVIPTIKLLHRTPENHANITFYRPLDQAIGQFDIQNPEQFVGLRVGNIGKTNHFWFFNKPISLENSLIVEEDVINYYNNDETAVYNKQLKKEENETDGDFERRKKKNEKNLFTILNDYEDICQIIIIDNQQYRLYPCFYELGNNGNIRFIGNTAYLRKPYENCIHNYIRNHQNESGIPLFKDFVSNIFGDTDTMGRVFFEDAISVNVASSLEKSQELDHKTLGSPKPTFTKNYLMPLNDSTPDSFSNSNAKIRGYKQYWHRPNFVWSGDNNSAQPKISPLTGQAKFNGNIRFHNLSDAELGLLLIALELQDGCMHKLGYGKPLGMGTVEIKVTRLITINTVYRYKTPLDFRANLESKEKEVFKDKFVVHLYNSQENSFQGLSKGDYLNHYWENDSQMVAIKMMLHFDREKQENEDWRKETRYLSVQAREFRNADILPEIKEVYKTIFPVLPEDSPEGEVDQPIEPLP